MARETGHEGAGSMHAMSETMSARMVTIRGHGGDDVESYLARPAVDGRRGGVVVIHHMIKEAFGL